MREDLGPCPVCGASAPVQGVYKHRWRVCARCGNASREARDRVAADRLPAPLRRLLPASLSVDPGVLADLPGTYYPSPEARLAAYQREAEEVDAQLLAQGVATRGRVLDLCGGPGVVLARLGGPGSTLLEYSREALRYAREELAVDARFFDFQGEALPRIVSGPYDLLLCRYGLAWCLDLPRLASGMAEVAAPGALAVLLWVLPTRGGLLTSALEDYAPLRLWSEAHVGAVFAEAGWALDHRFEPCPPMPHWRPHRAGFRLFSLPWRLARGPLPRDPFQRHAGLVLRYARPSGEEPLA